MRKRGLFIAGLMSTLLLLVGCGTDQQKADEVDKVKVVTTLFPQYDFTRAIGGDKVDVSLLLPFGMDSHSYEPTPADLININKSDLFIYTGESMEPWAHSIIESVDNNDVLVLDVSKGVSLIAPNCTIDEHDHESEEDHDHESEADHDHEAEVEHDHESEADHDHEAEVGHDHESEADHDHEAEVGHDHESEEDHDHGTIAKEHSDHDGHDHTYDPHIWTSPKNAMIMVQNILEALCEVDPENADYYQANADAYLNELEALNHEFEEVVAHAKRQTIYHGGRFAMQYLTNEYGINYISAPFEAEPSAALVAQMIKEMKEQQIPAIYYEELVDPKISQMISEETGAQMLLLHSCHNVSKEEFNQGVTYLSLMKQNVENLRVGLN